MAFPALGAFSKGSEGEQSHACRELTPIAIYLREMCQARKSNITQRGYNKWLTWRMLGWRWLLTKMTCEYVYSLDQSRNQWTRGDLIDAKTLQNPETEAMGLVFFFLCKTKQYYQIVSLNYRQNCILGLWSYFWVRLEGPGWIVQCNKVSNNPN